MKRIALTLALLAGAYAMAAGTAIDETNRIIKGDLTVNGVLNQRGVHSAAVFDGGVGKFDSVDAGSGNVVGIWKAGTLKGDLVDAGSLNVEGTATFNNITLASTAWCDTAPTVTACAGGTAASITFANGPASFVFDVGTACASESTAVITLCAAANGWNCSCSSTTADRVLQQKVIPGANATTVTIQNIVMSTGANGDFTDSADVGCMCAGY